MTEREFCGWLKAFLGARESDGESLSAESVKMIREKLDKVDGEWPPIRAKALAALMRETPDDNWRF